MKYTFPILGLFILMTVTSCSNKKKYEKGFQVSTPENETENETNKGIKNDSLKIETRPSSVLMTGIPNVRLTSIFKVNLNKRNNSTFIGSDNYHNTYEETEENTGNNWHGHLMPGLEAVYGYNMVNISHYDIKENKQKTFFEKPALIRTLYYPAFTKDTLNKKPISRNYFIVSVYNEDTDKDGFINLKDLRRLFLFDIHGVKQKALIPENFSVFKSKYDSDNDYMFVFAQLDSNNNGRKEDDEPIHIFWIDLKDPTRTGQQY